MTVSSYSRCDHTAVCLYLIDFLVRLSACGCEHRYSCCWRTYVLSMLQLHYNALILFLSCYTVWCSASTGCPGYLVVCRCRVSSNDAALWIIDHQEYRFDFHNGIDLGNGDTALVTNVTDTYIVSQLDIHVRNLTINITCGGGGGEAILKSHKIW